MDLKDIITDVFDNSCYESDLNENYNENYQNKKDEFKLRLLKDPYTNDFSNNSSTLLEDDKDTYILHKHFCKI